MAKANRVLTPVARLLAFQPLNVKTEFDNKTKKFIVSPAGSTVGRYNATFLIPMAEDVAAIQAAMKEAARDCNPSVEFKHFQHKFRKGNALIEKALKKNPEKNADRMSYYKDMWVLEAKSVHLPDLSKAVNGKPTEVANEMVSREFYSGCFVKAEINFSATEVDDGEDENGDARFKRYVTAYHNFVIKVKDGERLGRKSREEVFKGALGGTSDKPIEVDDDVEF